MDVTKTHRYLLIYLFKATRMSFIVDDDIINYILSDSYIIATRLNISVRESIDMYIKRQTYLLIGTISRHKLTPISMHVDFSDKHITNYLRSFYSTPIPYEFVMLTLEGIKALIYLKYENPSWIPEDLWVFTTDYINLSYDDMRVFTEYFGKIKMLTNYIRIFFHCLSDMLNDLPDMDINTSRISIRLAVDNLFESKYKGKTIEFLRKSYVSLLILRGYAFNSKMMESLLNDGEKMSFLYEVHASMPLSGGDLDGDSDEGMDGDNDDASVSIKLTNISQYKNLSIKCKDIISGFLKKQKIEVTSVNIQYNYVVAIVHAWNPQMLKLEHLREFKTGVEINDKNFPFKTDHVELTFKMHTK